MNQTNKKKILIADDELSIRILIRKFLSKDYVVLEAPDGEEAVNMARSQKPDLILLDFTMPKLDGVGACKVIKSDSEMHLIPVVIFSARGHELDQEYAKDMGADGYITKPFSSHDLLNTISKVLSGSDQ